MTFGTHPVYIYTHTFERGLLGGALNLSSTSYPDHGRCGDLPLQGKIRKAEPGITGNRTRDLMVRRSSDHQTTSLGVPCTVTTDIWNTCSLWGKWSIFTCDALCAKWRHSVICSIVLCVKHKIWFFFFTKDAPDMTATFRTVAIFITVALTKQFFIHISLVILVTQ
jgi:hypothetical protein